MDIQQLVLGILFYIQNVIGGCGNCQDNFIACHSMNTFSLCIEGDPRPHEILYCPNGTVCTDQPGVCIESTNSSFEASCGKGCEVCNSHDNLFACIDTSTPVFCFGGEMPYYASAKASCPEGYVCDLSNRAVCVKKDASMASCNKDLHSTTKLPDVTSTTARAPRDAETFCRENKMEGTFPKEGDTTCTEYIICQAISNGTKFRGYSYTCSGNDYFDPVIRWCTKQRPATC